MVIWAFYDMMNSLPMRDASLVRHGDTEECYNTYVPE